MTLELITQILTVIVAIVYLSLPLIYAFVAKTWFSSQTGRAVMWLLFALGIAVAYVAAGVLWGIHPGRVAFRFVAYTVLITAGVRFAIYMFQTQIEAARKR